MTCLLATGDVASSSLVTNLPCSAQLSIVCFLKSCPQPMHQRETVCKHCKQALAFSLQSLISSRSYHVYLYISEKLGQQADEMQHSCNERSRYCVGYKVEHTVTAHPGGLQALDARGNFLATCGYGMRLGQMALDTMVKVCHHCCLCSYPVPFDASHVMKIHFGLALAYCFHDVAAAGFGINLCLCLNFTILLSD